MVCIEGAGSRPAATAVVRGDAPPDGGVAGATLPAFKINQENLRDGNESSERTLGQAKQWPNRPCAKKRSGEAFRKSNRTERSARGSQTRPWHPLMITVSPTGLGKSSPGRLRI